MIPWKTGQKGTWSLYDRFEEIYLDDFSREKVPLWLKIAKVDQTGLWSSSGVSGQNRANQTTNLGRVRR
jgi:hypothetical protein